MCPELGPQASDKAEQVPYSSYESVDIQVCVITDSGISAYGNQIYRSSITCQYPVIAALRDGECLHWNFRYPYSMYGIGD